MNAEAERLLAILNQLTATFDGLDDLQCQRLKPVINDAFDALERAVRLLEDISGEDDA